MQASGSCNADAARDAPAQADGSCGTFSVHDVMVEPVNADDDPLGQSSVVTNNMKNAMMMNKVFKATKRPFKARYLQRSRGVRNWTPAPMRVMPHLLALVQCVSVLADVPLCKKSSLHVRAELRSKLAAALARGDRHKAFAKQCGFSGKPLANDPEAMMATYPNVKEIDYSAAPVQSGINGSLWKFWHARHCVRCTQARVHKDCYFKPMVHFLDSGFELPVKRGFDIYAARPSRVAYVDKWREEETRCKLAFKKWAEDSSGLMSPVVTSTPKVVFPLLPVVRAKDAWRHSRTGEEYKVRLCVDFKNGGLNDMLEDWPFRQN